MALDVVETLSDLIRLPSVNPMGRDVQGDEYFEYRVTAYLEALFDRLELRHRRQTIGPKQDNIVAILPGVSPQGKHTKTLLFEAHQDTVPVDGMTIPPWDAEIRDGRVFGRGACDIKGGMACMLTAISRLAEQNPDSRPTIVMACSVNEEYGTRGASQIPRMWLDEDERFLAHEPDAAIVTEPTELNVVVAHKGTVRWRCRTSGVAAHSSRPDQGDNAIYRMAAVVKALEKYANDILPGAAHHPRLGQPTLSVGLISGGSSVNIVPDHCTIEIDRRVLPNEDPATAYEQVRTYLRDQLGERFPIEHESPYQQAHGLTDNNNASLAELLSVTIRDLGGPGRCEGVPYGTDAPAFATANIPTVVFGPGSIDQAHTRDEWIRIDQLHAAVDILCEFALRFHGQDRG